MKSHTILLYCKGIDDVLSDSSKVAGIQVQMSFWAQNFVKHGWNVYSFSEKETGAIKEIHFIHIIETWLDRNGLSIIQDAINTFDFLRKTKADVVFLRGARRDLFFLWLASHFTKTKVVFLGASDKDFIIGEELDKGRPINMKLFRRAMSKNKYFVAQNQFQSDMLYKNYGKNCLILPNIWPTQENTTTNIQKYDAIWVANLRRLKRAEWFLDLAKQMPQYKFAIVGGVNEQDYFDLIKKQADHLPNVDFLDAQPFNEVNHLLSQSKMLICTSEFEGFPNTFLQAWAHQVPVISTVDPSDVIKNNHLGKFIENEKELLEAFVQINENQSEYNGLKSDIVTYFYANHDANLAFDKITHYLEIEK